MEFIAKKFDNLTPHELYEILKSRSEIFLLEQGIKYQDMDDLDYRSLHCFIYDNDRVIACMRAYYIDDGVVKIGRVLTLSHGNGTGSELMRQSLLAIQTRLHPKKIRVDAQKHAEGFYKKHGFKSVTDDFIEEGIVHVGMELELL